MTVSLVLPFVKRGQRLSAFQWETGSSRSRSSEGSFTPSLNARSTPFGDLAHGVRYENLTVDIAIRGLKRDLCTRACGF